MLAGTVKLVDMPRIANNLNKLEGNAEVELQFGKDEQKLAYVRGQVKAAPTLQCQRCMGPMIYEIMADFALGIVNTLDEANALPSHYEPAMTSEGQLALRELVEDELILSLPIIPRHEPDACHVKLPLQGANLEKEEKRENPFHVLETLKQK